MDGTQFVDGYYARLAASDLGGVVELYGDGAEIIRYDGVARTADEIREYHATFLARNGSVALRSVDQIRQEDDVLMWDALVDTDLGVLQAVHVVIFDDDGRIRRHIPGMRGFWGQ